MTVSVGAKVLNTAATTMGKAIGEAGVDMVMGRERAPWNTGVMSGLEATEGKAAEATPKTTTAPRQVTQVDPWAILLKWGGPVAVVCVGAILAKAAWSWAGSAGRCTK